MDWTGDQTAVTHYYRKLHLSYPHSHRSRHRNDCWPHTVDCSRAWNPFDSSCCLKRFKYIIMLEFTEYLSDFCHRNVNDRLQSTGTYFWIIILINSVYISDRVVKCFLPQYCIFSSDLSLQWAIPSQVNWYLMHSPFPHSNSVWMLQEEFSAADEDNKTTMTIKISKLNCVYRKNIYTCELRGYISMLSVLFTPAIQFGVMICKCHKCIQ